MISCRESSSVTLFDIVIYHTNKKKDSEKNRSTVDLLGLPRWNNSTPPPQKKINKKIKRINKMAQPARATAGGSSITSAGGGFKHHIGSGVQPPADATRAHVRWGVQPPDHVSSGVQPPNHVSWGVHSELALGKKHKNSPRWMNSAPPKFSIGWAFH